MEECYRLVDGTYTGGKVYTYTRGYILDAEGEILWISLFGSSMSLKTLAAQLFSGQGADVRKANTYQYIVRIQKGEHPLRALTQVTADLAIKIIFQPYAFTPWKSESKEKRILVFGETLDHAQAKLFRVVDRMISTPLSPRWARWIWDSVDDLDIRFFVPDIKQFNICHYVQLPEDFEEKLLYELRSGALTLD
jgi:hypothetical protein